MSINDFIVYLPATVKLDDIRQRLNEEYEYWTIRAFTRGDRTPVASESTLDEKYEFYGWDNGKLEDEAANAAVESRNVDDILEHLGMFELFVETGPDVGAKAADSFHGDDPKILERLEKARVRYTIVAPIDSAAHLTSEIGSAVWAAIARRSEAVHRNDDVWTIFDCDPDEVIEIDLTEAERKLLQRGLFEWWGPTRCTE